MIAFMEAVDPSARFTAIAPQGPHHTDGGPAWFAPDWDDETDTTLAVSLGLLDEVVADESRVLGVDPSEALVIGYSQGGATALASALRGGAPHRFDRVVAVAGYLPDLGACDEGGPGWAFAEAAGSTSVLLVHGMHDESVPVVQARSAARVLERNGIEVDLVEVDADHRLGGELASVVAAHLTRA